MSKIHEVSPFKCRVWDLHDRLGENIDIQCCSSLIESIRKNGQKHPVLGRRIPESDGYSIELIYGARRLFATQHLRINLLVDIRKIDDREALIAMDIENRVRTDISPYERGISYSRWLRAGFFNSQVEIARAVGVSEAQISRLLRYSELPAVVVASFSSASDIREEWAGYLSKQCADPTARTRILRHAREIASSSKSHSPQQAFDLLIRNSGDLRPTSRSRDEVIKTPDGTTLFRVGYRSRSVHFIVPKPKVPEKVLRKLVKTIQGTLSA